MIRTSVLTLLTASLMVASPAAFAQVSVGTDVTATQTVDANGDGNISAEEQAAADAAASASGEASASGSATATLTIDANGDGAISAEEVAAANAAIEASGNASIVLDANGDGTVTLEEANAAQAALGATVGDTVACETGGLAGMMSGMTMAEPATITAATNVHVVLVSNCSADEVTSALATEGATNIRGALQANAAAVAAIQSRGATMADVLGATAEGDTVTVYVAARATAS
jgi:hypothetical protein